VITRGFGPTGGVLVVTRGLGQAPTDGGDPRDRRLARAAARRGPTGADDMAELTELMTLLLEVLP